MNATLTPPPPFLFRQIAAIIDADEKAKRQRGMVTDGPDSPLAAYGSSDPELVGEVLDLKKQVAQLKEMVMGKRGGGGIQ
jgi:hypothetical protein